MEKNGKIEKSWRKSYRKSYRKSIEKRRKKKKNDHFTEAFHHKRNEGEKKRHRKALAKQDHCHCRELFPRQRSSKRDFFIVFIEELFRRIVVVSFFFFSGRRILFKLIAPIFFIAFRPSLQLFHLNVDMPILFVLFDGEDFV